MSPVETDPRTIDIYDPDHYIASTPHEVFAYLRREHPVWWQPTPDGGGYWAVMRHADVLQVARTPAIFSAALGGIVLDDLPPEQLERLRGTILSMDPPRHTDIRRNLSPHFSMKVMGALEGRIREICRGLMDNGAAMGEVDFVHDVCAALPAQVVGRLVGIPEDDWEQITRWAEQTSGGQDPDLRTADTVDAASASLQMAMYGINLARQWRQHIAEHPHDPPENLTSLMLGTEIDGHAMTDIEFGSLFSQIVTAGNDTTRTMLSSGLLALLTHPDQMDALRAHPELAASAIEEVLRFSNPLHYFRRTATVDAVVHGQVIAAGQKVAMMYSSANRDEDVFDRPNEFNIRRDPNPHVSFGFGNHFCLGVHLARLEGRVFFEELLSRFRSIELIGEPKRQRSNLNNSLKLLPVRLTE